MSDLAELFEIPVTRENYLIAGWRQWADAGQISSGLPQYLIGLTGATKIGEIIDDDFYLFQIPGTHHLVRPQVKLEDGHVESMSMPKNELYYSRLGDRGLLIFLGEEPHQRVDVYASAFFDLIEAANVKRTVALGGVYGALPYDRDRNISCVYSLPELKEELERYAITFSDYEGGSTIGTYLAYLAGLRDLEFIVFYAFVPAYDFTQLGITIQGLRIDEDWKSWYDLMRRLDYMFGLGVDLLELETQSHDLIKSWDARIEELTRKRPELNVKSYMEEVSKEYEEHPFMPLDDAWDELDDLLQGMDD